MGNTIKLRSQERVLVPKSENRMEDEPHMLEQIRPKFKSLLTAFAALLSHLSCGSWHPLPAALAGLDRIAEDTNERMDHMGGAQSKLISSLCKKVWASGLEEKAGSSVACRQRRSSRQI